LQHQRHRCTAERVGGGDVEVEGLLEVVDLGVEEGVGDGAADVVDDDVEAPEGVVRRLRQPGDLVGAREVGRYDDRASPGGLDPLRDLGQLRLGACGDQHVRAGLGERDGGGG